MSGNRLSMSLNSVEVGRSQIARDESFENSRPAKKIRKPYNHCRHAGNACDVFKHIVLLDIVSSLLAKKSDECFHYLDTHGGPGLSHLGELGEWTKGFGTLVNHRSSFEDKSPVSRFLDLEIPAMTERSEYKGSWTLLAKLAKQNQLTSFKGQVYEINADTLKIANATLRKSALESCIKIHPRSGYDGALVTNHASFVFLDPKYRGSEGRAQDITMIRKVVSHGRTLGSKHLLWYPVYNHTTNIQDMLLELGGTRLEITLLDPNRAHLPGPCQELQEGLTLMGSGLWLDTGLESSVSKELIQDLASAMLILGMRLDVK